MILSKLCMHDNINMRMHIFEKMKFDLKGHLRSHTYIIGFDDFIRYWEIQLNSRRERCKRTFWTDIHFGFWFFYVILIGCLQSLICKVTFVLEIKNLLVYLSYNILKLYLHSYGQLLSLFVIVFFYLKILFSPICSISFRIDSSNSSITF